ncbi:MAG: DNA polymerase III subunit delta [Elusimicrobia bacterium]|nr:DNA polymerase III subunit delta [Elusimicrobiota bacterium]
MPEISPAQLAEEWSKEKLRSVYYLSGEETFLKKEAVSKLKERFKNNPFSISEHIVGKSDINEIILDINTPSLISDTRVIILHCVEKASKEEKEKIRESIKTPSASICVVLICDKKSDAKQEDAEKAVLEKQGAVVNFRPFNVSQSKAWIQDIIEKNGQTITSEALEFLVEISGTDAAVLKQETEKLLIYHSGRRKPVDARSVIESTSFSKEENPFELSKAIYGREKDKAVELVEKLLKEGFEPLRLLYNISSALEKIYKSKKLFQSGMSSQDIYFSIGVSRGYYGFIEQSSRRYSEEKLAKGLRRCLEAESMLKSSTDRNPGILLKQLVYEIFR